MGLKNILNKAVAKTKELVSEIAYSVPCSNRSPWSDFSLVQYLTPSKLADIITQVKQGQCPSEYLELASDIELKDPHYRSVLDTRKLAVIGLDFKVVPASSEKKDLMIAEAVERDIILNSSAGIYSLVYDMLDALAKGFSVNEIIWQSKNNTWLPYQYKFRDSRHFQYDALGERLMLRGENGIELQELMPYKFIIHEPKLKSGLQILSGLALPVLFYFLLKYYDITSWAAFIDRFGYPFRLGKYSQKATKEDIRTLKKAVAAIGSDFGAIIPESAILEIIESKTTNTTSDAYERLADYVNKEVSKVILGQTMTTEDGASYSQANVHNEVRDDVADADIRQILETLNAKLTNVYCNFNFGELEKYPRIVLFKPDTQNREQVISAIANLGNMGLKVKADEVRNLLGLSKPEPDDETIGGRGQDINDNLNSYNNKLSRSNILSLNNSNDDLVDKDNIDEMQDEFKDDYIEIENDIVETLEKVFDKASNFETLKKELEKLASTWDAEKISKAIAVAFFMARAKGFEEFARQDNE